MELARKLPIAPRAPPRGVPGEPEARRVCRAADISRCCDTKDLVRPVRDVQVGRGPPQVFGGIPRIETEDDAPDVGGRAKLCIGGMERAQVRRADPRTSREHGGEAPLPLPPEAPESALPPP